MRVRTDKETGTDVATRAKAASKKADNDGGAWVALAWAAWCCGDRCYTALGKQFGKHRTTVKAQLDKYSKQRATELADGTDATAEYLDSVEALLCELWALYRMAEQESTKLGCLKQVSEQLTKLAAARGVVTERKGVENSGEVTVHGDGDSGVDKLLAFLAGRACEDAPGDAAGSPEAADSGGAG